MKGSFGFLVHPVWKNNYYFFSKGSGAQLFQNCLYPKKGSDRKGPTNWYHSRIRKYGFLFVADDFLFCFCGRKKNRPIQNASSWTISPPPMDLVFVGGLRKKNSPKNNSDRFWPYQKYTNIGKMYWAKNRPKNNSDSFNNSLILNYYFLYTFMLFGQFFKNNIMNNILLSFLDRFL